MVALLAVLVSENERRALLVMTAVPAELESRNDVAPLFVIIAFPAVLALLKKKKLLLTNVGAFAELLTIPAPGY